MTPREFLVIGAGRFGSSLARSLTDDGHEVVVVDNDERSVDDIADDVAHAMLVDATDERAVAELGVDAFDTVIVAIGHDLDASILATIAAKSAGARHLISKAENAMIARALASVGADEVLRPEHEMGRRLASQLSTPGVFRTLNLGAEHRVAEVQPDDLEGSLAELGLPDRFELQVLAVRRGDRLHVNPSASFTVQQGDGLIVLAGNEQLERFIDEECT